MDKGHVIVNGVKYNVELGSLNLEALGITSIHEIKGLNNLTHLKSLFLGFNNIQLIEGLENLINL